MSNRSPLTNESIGPSNPEAKQERNRSSRYLRSIKGPAQFLSFWVAIALPFVHLPLLAQGLGNASVTMTFLTLLTLNVCALYIGHGYKQ